MSIRCQYKRDTQLSRLSGRTSPWAIGRPEAQLLHGAVEHGEHGLFVTRGSFSADARTFERTKPNLRLIDGSALIELIYTHYHQFEPRYQMLLPLKRSYIPSTVVVGAD